MQPSRPSSESRQVVICAANAETLDGLEAYLSKVGMRVKGRRRLEDCLDSTTDAAFALVLFPDDFAWRSVETVLAELAGRCKETLLIVVTSRLHDFERFMRAHDNVVVVPRPVWGWTILDTIRAHAERDDEARSQASK